MKKLLFCVALASFSILLPSALPAPPLCGDLQASVSETFNSQFSTLSAQTATDFRIQVATPSDDPVGFAYVFVGDEYYTMVDAEGTTTIPASKLKPGIILQARFVGMESEPLVWNGGAPAGSVITLRLIPNAIDEVVVTAKSRDRSRQLYRKYVEKLPTQGWYTGFTGDYQMNFTGYRPWNSRGMYVRNHVPGDDANLRRVNTFSLVPERAADSLIAWQIQRNILLVSSIAERAVQLDGYVSNRDMVMKYRGRDGNRHVFLIIKPWFDAFTGADDSFQTLIWVNDASGIVTSSQSVSRTKYGIWNVSADYAVYSSGIANRSDRFIYPVRITGKYEERNPSAEDAIAGDIMIENITARHFAPEPVPENLRP